MSWLLESAALDGNTRILSADPASLSPSSLHLKEGHFLVLDLCVHQSGVQSDHIFLLLLDVVERPLGSKKVFYP